MHLLGISGSLRTGSLRAAQELAPDGMIVELATLHGIPLFNADEERAHGYPQAVVELRERLRASDAMLIATPEYNYSIPGVLKNALDWLSRGSDSPLDDKPAGLLGAGGRFGTVRAQAHLRDTLLHNRVRIVAGPEVYIDRAREKFVDGRLIDERARDQIRRLLEALAGT